MVREFERHHAWRFPSAGPAGFDDMIKSGGEGGSWRLHVVQEQIAKPQAPGPKVDFRKSGQLLQQ